MLPPLVRLGFVLNLFSLFLDFHAMHPCFGYVYGPPGAAAAILTGCGHRL